MMQADEIDTRLNQLLRLVDENSRPNVNALWMVAKDIEAIKLNVKFFGYALAKQLSSALPPATRGLSHAGLVSKLATQADIESEWFSHWMAELRLPVLYLRKLWEFAYVLQGLYEGNVLARGTRGVGFGVGEEPIASYLASQGVTTVVTDLPSKDVRAQGWQSSHEHASSLEKVFKPDLVDRVIFADMVAYRSIDMTDISDDLRDFDFCWSICALEHLGSIATGQDFIRASLKCLKPGGIAIHTLEYNCLSEGDTVDNAGTVLFQRKHLEDLADLLKADGHSMAPLNFDLGAGIMDRFVDVPPFVMDVPPSYCNFIAQDMQHLKLASDGFIVTCFGIIIRKDHN
jgi:hypothetical protein